MIRKIALLCIAIAVLVFAVIFTRSGERVPLDPKNPVVVILWHTYWEQMKVNVDDLIDEFNNTVGAERGIVIQAGLVADAKIIDENLLAVINDRPGAPALPDIAVIYPRIGVLLAEKDLLMDFSTQFDDKELSMYIPEFLEEGKLGGEKLYILPVAKSTEALYVNAAIFNRFANDTGVTLAQLDTFEGILDAAGKYYDWSGGKAFIHMDDLCNYTMVGFQQLGGDFFANRRMNLTSPIFKKIWDSYYPPAVKGGVAIFEGYGSNLAKTGDTVCFIGTTAGIVFLPASVTYADNTKEDANFTILSYPVFSGGEKVAIQRGGGMCVFKSDAKTEYAAGVFLKWLTAPEQNLRFTRRTGYIPVTEAAYEDFKMAETDSQIMRKLFETVTVMQSEYRFHIPPVFDEYEDMRRNYRNDMTKTAESSRQAYLGLINEGENDQAAYDIVSGGVFESFINRR
jgi:multiple sugar transport system substrate-binding protein